jgi:hypothetical protein
MALNVGVAALLALGFLGIGDLVLRRRSTGLQSGNESFLVGAGVSSAALFPLSLLLPRHAVTALSFVVGIASAAAITVGASRLLRRRTGHRRVAVPRTSGVERVLFALVVLAFAVFVVVNFRYTLLWDGFTIFAARAKRLFYDGGMTREWFPEGSNRLLAYPPLVALYEALVSRIRGTFDFDAFKALFAFFHASLLLSTFAALRARTSRAVALGGTVLVAYLPELSTNLAAAGNADMPQAAFVAGAVAACLRRPSRRAAPWLIGALTVAKPEGTILALIASGAVLAFWSAGGLRLLLRRLVLHLREIAVVASFLILRLANLRWLDVHDGTYGPLDGRHFAQALDRLTLVANLCGRVLLDPRSWGVLWPAFLIASLLLAARGARRERWLAASAWASVLAYCAIFLFTNWPVELHVEQAFGRLLAQVAPAAAVTIGLAYARAESMLTVRGMPASLRVPPAAVSSLPEVRA